MSPTQQAEQNNSSADNGSQVVANAAGASSPGAAAGPLEQASGNIDKIRDILFGGHMRENDTRFARLEESLVKESAELRESTRRRFETLENYVKKELESSQTRLREERDERSAGSSQLSRELKDLGEALSKKIRHLDDQATAGTSELRQEILNQARTLMDELKTRHDEISSLLERRFQVLQHGKTDRSALASLLTEVAMRINDEFRIPGAEK